MVGGVYVLSSQTTQQWAINKGLIPKITNSPPNCHYLSLIFFLGMRALKNIPSLTSMPIDIIVIDNNSNIVLICIPISSSERFHGDQALKSFSLHYFSMFPKSQKQEQ